MRSIIATIIASQKMPKKQIDLHRKVVEHFLPNDVDYVQYESPRRLTTPWMSSSCNHGGNIDRILRAGEYDNYLLLEVDAIPIKKGVFEELLSKSEDGWLVGPAQRTQWECLDDKHIYVAPCALSISQKTYLKIGSPTAHPNPRADTAEEFTYKCEELDIPILCYMPITTDGPKKWKLLDGVYYGPGTTYKNGIWHKFGEDLGIEAFYTKCEQVLSN